jgi:hypothetical protein
MNVKEFTHRVATPLSVAKTCSRMLGKELDKGAEMDLERVKKFQTDLTDSIDKVISAVKEVSQGSTNE